MNQLLLQSLILGRKAIAVPTLTMTAINIVQKPFEEIPATIHNEVERSRKTTKGKHVLLFCVESGSVSNENDSKRTLFIKLPVG
jgi:hypothetical protein